MAITKRGVSPRIVEAKLIGTGGTTKVRGDQLESALGSYSTWMNFQKVVNGKVTSGGGGKEGGRPGPAGGIGG